jgi:F-type H+-transporting ATPase subunit a
MLKVFATFVVLMGSAGAGGSFGAAAPLAVNVALVGFEFLVAFLQAYVFAILTSIYLHDAVHLH